MWQTPKPKFTQSSAKFLHNPIILPTLLAPKQIQNIPTNSPTPTPTPSTPIKQFCKLSRRELAIFSNSSLLLLLGSQALLDPILRHHYKAHAEEEIVDNNIPDDQNEDESSKSTTSNGSSSIDSSPTKRAFLDVSINGEPIGRIIIGLDVNKAPAGAARFSDLVTGAAGITYRRKEFIKILPNYVQHGGVRSYGVDAELAKKTGSNLINDSLVSEWERTNETYPGTKNLAWSVGIVVRDPYKPPPKTKLVARKGKLEIDEEEIGKEPNGTEFVIATKDSPELDASALVIGRVLEGMEVVDRIGQVKTVQENTTSPYFRVAKLIGDKRAVVAERGFNRPYSKVVVTNCGLLQ